MIFPEQVVLHIGTRIQLPGGGYDTVYEDRTVQAVVTFVNTADVQSLIGENLFGSRFRFYLSPYGEPIPAKLVTINWKEFTGLIVEGLIEAHYFRGRLHHYECIARTV